MRGSMRVAPLLLLATVSSASSVTSLLGTNLKADFWDPGVLLEATHTASTSNNTGVLPRTRLKRQLISFPDDAIMGFYFKLVVPYLSFPKVSTKGDYRVEVTYELPNSIFGLLRKKRSLEKERSSLYSILEDFFCKAGLDGAACVLRAVCEVGEAPLDEYGLLGEFITLVFAAGFRSDGGSLEHVQAEEYGRSYGSCWSAFPDCPLSIRDLLHQFFLNNGQIA